ncbi:MAG: hypothetical protein E7365_06290 [Clostridiales bacterium]|nr:hypothetical protein [Clostridiales bacterium]
MNEVEALPQMMLRQVANDVMLRINDVVLCTNEIVAFVLVPTLASNPLAKYRNKKTAIISGFLFGTPKGIQSLRALIAQRPLLCNSTRFAQQG